MLYKHKEADSKCKYKKIIGWDTETKLYLSKNPACEKCLLEGNIVPAVTVAHIIPPNGDFNLFWNEKNWISLCQEHYDKKMNK